MIIGLKGSVYATPCFYGIAVDPAGCFSLKLYEKFLQGFMMPTVYFS